MMNDQKYILALDQGTTSSRALIIGHKGEIVASAQRDFKQIFLQPGLVEHDAMEIWSSQSAVAAEAVAKANITGRNIAAIGITNQRETTIIWDRETSQLICNAIVWQDRRTAEYCKELTKEGYADIIKSKTGLIIDAYFSASKIKWILDNISGARERAERGELCFGTVNTWLLWRLTQGREHLTDVSNASRTMLFNIVSQEWDNELLALFDIPRSILPEVRSTSEVYCTTATTLFSTKIPIASMIGDQQAALFGQLCTEPGSLKTTYGTGCFTVMNSGEAPMLVDKLVSTIAWRIGSKTTYALEGSAFVGGAVIQWLRDNMHFFDNAAKSESVALSVEDSGGVYFVPALTGLGAPHWSASARGAIVGISRGTNQAHITRAALEGIAFEVYDIFEAMRSGLGVAAGSMRVDGGAVANSLLMQFQANVLGIEIVRPAILESTALGAAYQAGLAVGYWSSIEELKGLLVSDKIFTPQISLAERDAIINKWKSALAAVLGLEL